MLQITSKISLNCVCSDLNLKGPNVIAFVVEWSKSCVLSVTDLSDRQNPEISSTNPRYLERKNPDQFILDRTDRLNNQSKSALSQSCSTQITQILERPITFG